MKDADPGVCFLYRVLFYDCIPLAKRVTNPVTGRPVNYAISDIYKYRTSVFEQLKSQRKVALRLGKLKDNGGWQIKASLTKKLINEEKGINDLDAKDVVYQVQQKGVDMKIGLDIASLAYKRLVDQIILIAGDTDFVPAAKVARREGIDFILDPMHNMIDTSLNEHIDGLRSTSPKGGCSNIEDFIKRTNR
ncbi:MAG: NYN domain-containing protein [Spirochaetales bacterium]|nr:NYN domain-containing protein [Spirochaetales bacterium]